MALNSYFETLKLSSGASEFTLIEDRAVKPSASASPKRNEADTSLLRKALRTSATKFTMDECDEPLFCPTRQLSSSASSDHFESIDSLDALNTIMSSESLIDTSLRSTGSDNELTQTAADSRWTFPKNHDFPIHTARFSTGLKAPTRRSV